MCVFWVNGWVKIRERSRDSVVHDKTYVWPSLLLPVGEIKETALPEIWIRLADPGITSPRPRDRPRSEKDFGKTEKIHVPMTNAPRHRWVPILKINIHSELRKIAAARIGEKKGDEEARML